MGFPISKSKVSIRANFKQVLHQLLGASVTFLLVSLPLFSQSTQGTIQGAVTDQTGGVLVGATVSVIDVARGVTRALITDSAGVYVAANLTPGTYTVRAEAKGFRTVEHTGVLVEVGQNIRVDMVAQPGEQTQTITVTGEVPAVNTTDATLGGTVSNESINALPLNGRNFQRLVQLRPGVVTPVGSGTGTGQSTNGRRTAYDVLRVEGIAGIAQSTGANLLNTSYRAGDSASLVPIDAIQEFSAQQNPKAEYGFRDGSIVNVGVKSGTNSIHGTAYAFGRDAAATDAPNYFPGTSPGGVTPATMEQFGATAGGRIIKDKLFWFASFEGLRVLTGDVNLLTMPTSVAGAGVGNSFVDTCNAMKAAGTPISPLSAQLAGLNTTTCTVSPASSTVENVFPNNPSTTSVNFSPGLTSNGPLNNGLLKIDYNIGPHHHLNGLYYRSSSTQTVNSLPGQTLPQWLVSVPQNTYQYSGDYTWTPNSTVVSDFRMGYVYVDLATYPGDLNTPAGSPWPGGYGMPTGVTVPLYGGFPFITFTSFSGFLGAGNRTSTRGPEGNLDLVESVSYLRGKHTFKFGFEYIENIADGITFSLTQGNVNFTDLQSYLQGIPQNWTILLGSVEANTQNAHSKWYAGFVQDDWRIRPRVMLNLGLRYEYAGPPHEQNNNLSTFNLNATGNTPAIEQVGPGLPLSRMYDGDYRDFAPRLGVAWDVRGNGKTVVRAAAGILMSPPPMAPYVTANPFGANFPSIGVNTSGTAISALNAVSPGPPPGGCSNATKCGTFDWSGNPMFPGNQTLIIPAGTPGETAGTYTGFSCTPTGANLPGPCPVIGVDPNFKQPFSAQWNLDVQRAITSKLTVDVAYVGNHGYREEFNTDLNQPALGAGYDQATINACLKSQPVYNKCKPAGPEVGQYAATFPYISGIDAVSNGQFSNYDALQVTAQGRAYHGLSFLSGYTYSHALGEASASSGQGGATIPSDKTNLRLNYGNLNIDLRHRFTFSPTYDIPGMKSPAQMLEGWSISAILVVQGGLAWNPSDSKSTDWLGEGENVSNGNISGINQYWNYSGPRSAFDNTGPNPIPCYNGVSGKEKGCSTLAAAPAAIQSGCMNAAGAPYGSSPQLQALAVAALANGTCYTQGEGYLTPPAYGTLGDATAGLFTGPVYRNVDFSVAKLWKVKERYSAQFRVDFFNLFNRADFAGPGTDPSKGVTGGFGYATSTPDLSNPVLGSGGPRHVQFGLKLTF
jgi:hypothetical protein